MNTVGVSIIICTYNGIDRLSSTFDSILNLNPGIPRELILVDNASTDDIVGFTHSYFSQNLTNLDFKLIKEEKAGLSYARIAGIRKAKFDYILFCDDDNALFPDYLELGVQIFDINSKIGVIGGTGIAKSSSILPDWFSNHQRSYAVGFQGIDSGIIPMKPGHVYGAGSFYRTKLLLTILNTGFQPRLTGRTATTLLSGDDLEWCWLMQLLGYEIFFESKLKFFHELPPQRLSTEYYVNLKSGTASGSALLFAYRIFFENRNLSSKGFSVHYRRTALKHRLRFLKQRVFAKNKNWEHSLALEILKSRDQSFRTYVIESANLYRDLKSLFKLD